jgi:hypothetical protein
MAPLLFIAPAATAVDRALAAAEPQRPILVLHQPRLARALADRGRTVIAAVARPVRGGRLGRAEVVVSAPGELPAEPRTLGGLVAAGVGDRDDWSELLKAWIGAVADGGAIALLDQGAGRGRASELTRRALCAGLSEIEQRHAGRSLITSGLVTHL